MLTKAGPSLYSKWQSCAENYLKIYFPTLPHTYKIKCFRWVDTKNYIELIRPWYAKALPFPCNYYYPGSYEREAKKHLEALYDQDDDPQAIETFVSMQISSFEISSFVLDLTKVESVPYNINIYSNHTCHTA